MITEGTKVKLAINQQVGEKSPLVDLLNTLEPEVVGSSVEQGIPGRKYIVAFEVEHMAAIQQATNKEFHTKVNVQLQIVGLNPRLGRPKDPRPWYTVYSDEVSPA